MKKLCLLLIATFLFCFSYGQLKKVGEHRISTNSFLFSIDEVSPSEYLTVEFYLGTASDFIRVSYLDSTLYKNILFPPWKGSIADPRVYYNFDNKRSFDGPFIFPASRYAFNTDTLLEFLVFYQDTSNRIDVIGDILVINENGSIVDSFTNCSKTVSLFSLKSKSIISVDKPVRILVGPHHLLTKELYELNAKIGTSFAKIELNPEFKTSPNPFSHEIRISLRSININESSFITITDMNGRELSKIESLVGQEQVTWVASNISPGNYILTVTTNGVRASKKIVYIGEN